MVLIIGIIYFGVSALVSSFSVSAKNFHFSASLFMIPFFSDSETGAPFTEIIQIGTNRTMLNITLKACVRLKEECHLG